MPMITDLEIRSLAATRTIAPVTSCYLDVDGRLYPRQQDLNRTVSRLTRHASQRVAQDRGVQADLARITDYVRAGVDRSSNPGLAIFACGAAELFRVVPLPARPTSRVVVAPSPALGPLEALLSGHQKVGFCLLDQQRARVVVVDWGTVTEVPLPGGQFADADEALAPAGRAMRSPVLRSTLNALHRNGEVDCVVFGGPAALCNEIDRQVHPYLGAACYGRVPLGITATTEELRRAAMGVASDVAYRRREGLARRLRALLDEGKSSAVAGLGPVLELLASHRCGHILVSEGFEHPGWRCDACGRLAVVGRACPRCGAAMCELEDVALAAVDDALASGVTVDVCMQLADLDVVGRIGAFLRY